MEIRTLGYRCVSKLLFKRTLSIYGFLKGLVTIDYENCFWLTLCQYSSERDLWDVDLRSRCSLNAGISNSFSRSQVEDALEVMGNSQELSGMLLCVAGMKLLFVASLICLQNHCVTLFSDLVFLTHVTANRKM